MESVVQLTFQLSVVKTLLKEAYIVEISYRPLVTLGLHCTDNGQSVLYCAVCIITSCDLVAMMLIGCTASLPVLVLWGDATIDSESDHCAVKCWYSMNLHVVYISLPYSDNYHTCIL